jgi:hypothetical protein
MNWIGVHLLFQSFDTVRMVVAAKKETKDGTAAKTAKSPTDQTPKKAPGELKIFKTR